MARCHRIVTVVAGISIGFLAACTTAVNSRDAAEIQNIRQSNIIPKASARVFVQSFKTYCTDLLATLGGLPSKARNGDYVEIRSSGGFRTFVTDSRKPLVAFKQTPDVSHCYVAAEARTGQTAAVERFVAKNFSGNRQIDAGRSADDAWLVTEAPPTMVYLKRQGSPFDTPRVFLGIIQQH